MRLDSTEVNPRRGRARVAPKFAEARRSALRKSALESLERRTLMAVLPSPTVSGLVDISNATGAEYDPEVAVNPSNPLDLVATWTGLEAPPQSGTTPFEYAGARYSTDGGQTWTSINLPGNLFDPNTSGSSSAPFGQIGATGVGFDANNHFYVMVDQITGTPTAAVPEESVTGSAGAIVVTKFSFGANGPTRLQSTTAYEWFTSDGEAQHPTLAVDANQATFTDTDSTGATRTQTDPTAGNIYVAFTDHVIGPVGSTNYVTTSIALISSSDGGTTFGADTTLDDLGRFGSAAYGEPSVTVSQGTSDGRVSGGQVTAVWEDKGTLATASPPEAIIETNSVVNPVSEIFADNTEQPTNDAGAGTPNVPAVTDIPLNVNITDTRFTSLSNLSVKLNLVNPNLSEISIVLIPPTGSGLSPVTLVTNQTDAAGNTNTNIGISGANLGVVAANGDAIGTVFDDTAFRNIVDYNGQTRGAAAPFIGRFQPEERGGLSSYNGSTAATLNGSWTLQITDFRTGNTPSTLVNWSLDFASGTQLTGSDVSAAVVVAPLVGDAETGGDSISTRPVIASDNTLGAYSQFQGRLYVAYVDRPNPIANPSDPATDTNIMLITSDDGGQSWSEPVQVNDDDSLVDGQTESDPTGVTNPVTGRTQYQPELAVDQTTGTLAASWLDTRYDASNARTVYELTTSIDGGQTFSANEYVNSSQTATDAATGETVVQGPIPDNLTATASLNIALSSGFKQGLAFEAGHIYPAWESNENTINVPGTDSNVDIRIAPSVTAAGPRIIASTMGPVGGPPDPTNLYPVNLTSAADGTPQASAFVVTFDRPVDPSTFTTEQAQVFFRDTTANNATGRSLPVIAVVPLDSGFFGPASAFGAENFEVMFQPSSAVGTYSYTVGPGISDDIRSTVEKIIPAGPAVNFPSNDVPVPIPDVTTIDSTLSITGIPAGEVISNATVNFSINHTFDSDLVITLIAPDGTRILLVDHEGGGGHNFANTTLDDSASLPIGSGTAPFTGSFIPEEPLSALNGKTLNGTWTLQVADTVPIDSGTLLDWSLNLTPGTLSTAQDSGNLMDQDANAIDGELPTAGPTSNNDVYAAPNPEGGVILNTTDPTGKTYQLVGPFSQNTLPIIVPGPSVRSISNTAFNGPQSFSAVGGVAIGSATTAESTITVPDYTGGTITALTVNTTISFPTDGDLTLTLVAPDGLSAVLASGVGGAAGNFVNTTFSDSAPTTIASGSAPFTGSFRPSESLLGAFGALTPTGTWTLEVTNSATGVTGTINNFSLQFATDQDALALNKSVSSLDVTFDRDMDSSTITPATVLNITGPNGTILKPYIYPSPNAIQVVPTAKNGSFGAPLDSHLFINDDGTFINGDIGVLVNITSSSNVGLTLELVGPDGTTVVLASGAKGASYTNTVFDDSATQTIASGTAPYTGAFLPAGSLSAFNGKTLAGQWTLVVVNGLSGSTATLNSWSLVATPAVTITPITAQTYQINFPTQDQSGTYTVQLASTIADINGNLLDSNQNAGVALLENKATAGSSAPVTYPSNDVPLTIPASKTIDSSFTVGGGFVIQTVALTLNITYPNDPNLTATLIAPDGTRIILFSGVGSTGTRANFTNTLFSDSATTPIENAGPPFSSVTGYQPQEPLDVLVGRLVAGTYTLEISNAGTLTGSLNSWSLTFGRPLSISGLGEPVADQASESFRIFTSAPTATVATSTWTAVGPAPIVATPEDPVGGSGIVGALAVDPSDPSGNTVYVGGASGGVWKTTDFLTNSAAGPTYVPLTATGPTLGQNIGGIAVFTRNNDPSQSVVIAGTGFGDATNYATGVVTVTNQVNQGTGFLISQDGGSTWSLMDSTDNTLPFASRDHIFDGTSTFQVLVDPKPNQTTGGVIIYAALSGANGGVWRSIDTGLHWTKMLAGNATSIVLDPGSGVGVAGGNLQTIYAGMQGVGVFGSTNEGQSWNLLAGGQGNALLIDTNTGNPVPITAPPSTPNGAEGRIVLVKPALIPSTVADSAAENLFYSGWLYAAVVLPNDHVEGLYQTKDFGANWTLLKLSTLPPLDNGALIRAVPTNDSTQGNYDVGGGGDVNSGLAAQGNYDISLAIDPTNPNIVYLGGTYNFQPTGLIRVDATNAYDAHNVTALNGNGPGGTPVQINSTGSATLDTVNDAIPEPFLNYYRDPNEPFVADATLFTNNTATLTNTGAGVTWTPFDLGLNATGPEINGTFEQQLEAATPLIGDNIHRMISFIDPLTGYARLIIGTDNGVYSVVDNNGTYVTGIGSSQFGGPDKNGNLQLAAVNYGAVQASTASAQVAGNLFTSGTYSNGYASSDPDILSNGDLNWTTVGGDTGGVGVDSQSPTVDPTYAGSNYVFFWPCCGGDRTDFFQVGQGGTTLEGRTSGLLQSAFPGPEPDPQWPSSGFGANFAVNPVAGQQIIVSSIEGRLFRTTDQGLVWSVIADPIAQGSLPAALDGTYVSAPVFGAPDPAYTPSGGNLDDFIYAGTEAGHIFVTQNGGGSAGAGNAWINITNGDLATDEAANPTPIQQIITDPTPGSHDAYAVTANGVYYNINTVSDPGQAGASTWTRITGNLFSLTHAIFGNNNATEQSVTNLDTIAADWRYSIPNTGGGTHPVLYVGGQGGVFRSLDNGTTWAPYPTGTTTTTAASSGVSTGLPVTDVTDLEISAGNIDPATGRPIPVTGDPDVLVASTFGNGSYEIRLAPIVLNTLALDPTLPAPGGSDSGISNTDDVTNVLDPVIDGTSEISAFGTSVTVNLYDLTPLIAGGADQIPSAANFVGTATTTAAGTFQVQVEAGHFLPDGATDGVKTLGVQAVDQSGAAGNVATITFTLVTVPPVAPTIKLDPVLPSPGGSDTGINPTDDITNVNTPYIELLGVPSTGIYNLYRDNKLVATVVHTAANPLVGTTIAIQDPGDPISGGGFTPVADGTHIYKAQVTDLAGNVGPFSTNLSVTIDTKTPATPPPPILDSSTDSGTKGDNITNFHSPSFDGSGYPGGLIFLIDASGAVIGKAAVSANGTYGVTGGNPLIPSSPLPDGTYVFRVETEDVAGNISLPSTSITVTILSTVPTTPTLSLVPADNTGPPGQNVTNVTQPRLQGTSTAGLDVELIDVKGNITGVVGGLITPVGDDPPVVVNLGGTFQLQFPSPLADGVYVVLARVFDAAGNSADSLPLTLTIQTEAPSISTHLILNPADVYGVVTAGSATRTTVRRPVFGVSAVSASGAPASGTTIDLINQATGAVIASAVTGLNGTALESPAGNLPDGSITLIARAVDVAGNLSTPSNSLSLQIVTAAGDYFGDGVGDLSLFRPTTGQFLITELSGANSELVSSFGGEPGDIPIQGDFDGDGKIDPGFYRPSTGTWYIDRSSLGPEVIQFGEPNVDMPVPGDYDGDGLTDLAVYRPTTGQWIIARTSAGPEIVNFGGPAGFIPVPADYDGDGKTDLALYLPSTGQWMIQRSTAGPEVVNFGVPNVSQPVPADYDGDGKADLAIYNPTNGQWIILQSTAGGKTVTLGQPGDEPVPLDYDGDGKADIAVYRPSTGQWIIQGSSIGSKTIGFGEPNVDVPVPLPQAYSQSGSSSTLSVRSFSSDEVSEPAISSSSIVTTTPGSLDLGSAASRFSATSSAIPPVNAASPTVVPVAAPPVVVTPVLTRAEAKAEARALAKAKAKAAALAKAEAEAALRASRKAAHAHDLALAALIHRRS